LLIEHQSEPDPWMPLRVLLYAALFWNAEWKRWEREHPEGAPRLTPIIPIVFHTGLTRWRANRTLARSALVRALVGFAAAAAGGEGAAGAGSAGEPPGSAAARGDTENE
jgi:hypothetical protein